MKKIFLSLIALAATTFAGYADTSLAEAYSGLAKLPGMSEQTTQKVQIDNSSVITNVKTASVSASQGNVQDYRDNFIYMMENLPIRNMVIAANNMRELASVYAAPAGGGQYNILVITGDALSGNFSVSYGQTNAAGVKAMRECQVSMDATELVMAPIQTVSPNESFISMGDE